MSSFGLALTVAITCAPSVLGGVPTQVTYEGPDLDRWMYPFNATPGFRAFISTFGAFNEPQFDNRDGQMLIGFDTSGDVTPGLGAARYQITGARVQLQNSNHLVFEYDDTPDPYGALLDEDDPEFVVDDPGQAIELFGMGYRNDFTVLTFQENTPFTPGDPLVKQSRSAYALSYDDTGMVIDVSNSVDERYDPFIWAVGLVDGLAPGSLVPRDSTFTFDVEVSDPDVQAYLQDAMDVGWLGFAVTSHTRVVQQGGDFPTFHTKESLLVQDGFVSAARLELEVTIVDVCPGDLDGDGTVGFGDLTQLLGSWGVCPVPPPACAEDLDGDGTVGFGDLTQLLGTWGVCS